MVGTVAGDDTIFVATKDLKAQNHIQKQLLEKFA
jgi:arginine repressor